MLKLGVPIIVPPSPIVRRGRRPRLPTEKNKAKPKPTPITPTKSNDYYGSLIRQTQSRDSFISRFIEEHFSGLDVLSADVRRNLKSKETHYPKHDAYALVGTAIDFRLRAYFVIKPHECESIDSGLKIMLGNFRISEPNGEVFENTWRGLKSAEGISKIFARTFAGFLNDVHPRGQLLDDEDEEKLCRFCVLLAGIDAVGRTTNLNAIKYLIKVGNSDIDFMLSTVKSEIVRDVMLLSRFFYKEHSQIIRTFRKSAGGKSLQGSKDIGCADFDLLVDNCLFDFKTTIKHKINMRACLRQLIGYWLLDYDDRFRIRSVALCFTRQNYTHQFEIKDLLQNIRAFRDVRRAFRNDLRAFNRKHLK